MLDPFRDPRGRLLPGNPFAFRAGLSRSEQPSIVRHLEKIAKEIEDAIWSIPPIPRRRVYAPFIGIGAEWQGAHTLILIDEADKEELMYKLRNVAKPEKEIEKTLKEIGYYITDNVIPRIFREEKIGGTSWEMLMDRTLNWRAQIERPYSPGANPGGMLRPFGGLFKQVSSHEMVSVQEDGDTYRMTISGQNIKDGFRQKLFYWHQLGTDRMFPRPMIPIGEEDLNAEEKHDIRKIFQDHMDALTGGWED